MTIHPLLPVPRHHRLSGDMGITAECEGTIRSCVVQGVCSSLPFCADKACP